MNQVKNLALVDDDSIFVFLAKKVIKNTNRVEQVNVFENGQEVLNFIKDNKEDANALPEIILLDLSMPIMDGWQFLSEYTLLNPKLARKIAIYVCSSSISPDDVARAKTISEVSDYIIKPITEEKLTEVINSL